MEINKSLANTLTELSKISNLERKILIKSFDSNGALKRNTSLNALFENPSFLEMAENYATLISERANKVQDIQLKKKKMVEIAEKVLGAHQVNINKYLQRLSAAFRISDIGITNFASDLSQRLKYSISINGSDENIFGSNTVSNGNPYFDTLLSDADKRTLSFAFFMSKIEASPFLKDMIVVFDDPMSSFDSARKTATKQEILTLSGKVAQVIILSHDVSFLASFWLDSRVHSPSTLEVKKTGSFSSTLTEWNIAADYESEYIKNYKMLHAYLDGSPVCKKSVASSVRVVLEEYFRQKFPIDFIKKEWLGDFIGKVRGSNDGDNLYTMKPHLDELSSINEYASPFHHAPQPEIIEDELRSYVTRTIKILQA